MTVIGGTHQDQAQRGGGHRSCRGRAIVHRRHSPRACPGAYAVSTIGGSP